MVNFLIMYLIFSPIILASISYFVSKKYPKIREYFAISINVLEMIAMIILVCIFDNSKNNSLTINTMALGLSFKIDEFRIIYAFISIFLFMNTTAFSKEYMMHYENKDRYYFFYALTLCGVMGVFLSNDLFTLYCFFELMSLASYPLVIHDEKEESIKAGAIYLSIAIATGMVLLLGLFILYSQMGTLSFDGINLYVKENGISKMTFAAGLLALLGFGAKAGLFPLHVWLPKAHPAAPAPASALLSGILTKTGVFGIIIISSNIFLTNYAFGIILLILSILTMFIGALLALFSIDLKKTLALSSMSQIGFILLGISFFVLTGKEGSIAAQGALLHMMNHSIIKLVLFMCAGVIAMNIHSLDLNTIKGYGRKKPFFMIIFLIGALGIMSIPLFNCYASKTMIHEGILEYIHLYNLSSAKLVGFKIIEWLFLISGGLTIAYMTKLFVCIFVEKNEDPSLQEKYDNDKNYLSLFSKIIFVLSSIGIIIIGILPNVVGLNIVNSTSNLFRVDKLIDNIHFFSFESILNAFISIAIGAIVYLFIIRKLLIKNNTYLNLWPEKLDLIYLFYNPIFIRLPMLFILYVLKYVARLFDYFINLIKRTILKEYVYHTLDSNLAYRIGALIDNVSNKKEENHYANGAKSFSEKLVNYLNLHTSNFSFAFAMICVGLIIIIAFALLS